MSSRMKIIILSLYSGIVLSLLVPTAFSNEIGDLYDINYKLIDASQKGNIVSITAQLIAGSNVNTSTLSGYTPLMLASFNGHKNAVQLLIKKGAKIDAQNLLGESVLMQAVQGGHLDIVKLLIEKGANVNHSDSGGNSILSYSLRINREDIAKYLVLSGKEVSGSSGDLAMMWGCVNKKKNFVELLLNKGANVDVSYYGKSCLSASIPSGPNADTALPILLIEHGANLSNKILSRFYFSIALSGHIDLLDALLKREVDVNIPMDRGQHFLYLAVEKKNTEIVKKLVDYGADLDVQSSSGLTPLGRAVVVRHADSVRILLENGANYKIKINKVSTPFSSAIGSRDNEIINIFLDQNIEPDFKEIKMVLITGNETLYRRFRKYIIVLDDEKKASLVTNAIWGKNETIVIDLFSSIDKKYYRSMHGALSRAATKNRISIAKYFLEAGVPVNPPANNKKINPAIVAASEYGNHQLVRLLVSKGADVNRTRRFSITALMSAVDGGYTWSTQSVMRKRKSLDKKRAYNYMSSTVGAIGHSNSYPDNFAYLKGRHFPSIVSYLLKHGADPNIQDSRFGQTALMRAAIAGHEESARLLIQAGTKQNIKDKNGKTARQLASDNSHTGVVRLLSKSGMSSKRKRRVQ